MFGKLGDGRAAAERDRQLVAGAVDGQVELLKPARHLNRPALVAEIALDLADDRGRGVRRELHAALQLEPVDRFEQSYRSDLNEIVEGLAAIRKTHREKTNEVKMHDDELVAQLLVLRVRCIRRRFVTAASRNELRKKLTGPLAVRTRFVPLGHYPA